MAKFPGVFPQDVDRSEECVPGGLWISLLDHYTDSVCGMQNSVASVFGGGVVL